MIADVFREIMLPFAGTTLGAASVFFVRKSLPATLQRALSGFAAGVMVAAAIWGLLIPSMEQTAGVWAFIPALGGLWLGFLFLMLLDKIIPHLHLGSACPEGMPCKLKRSSMMMLAVALHNLPEGMAVGALLAGTLQEGSGVAPAAALALSVGIAIQNFPEGAIISIPLRQEGMQRGKAFGLGVLSGLVEPIGAVATLLLANLMLPVLPWLLAFAAGAMLYVVVEELIPEMAEGEHSHVGTVLFALGFSLMMVLDVVLG